MSTWKKAISLLAVAGIAASLFASPVLATKASTATGADQSDILDCTIAELEGPADCQQVAGGISTVTLSGDASAGSSTNVYVTISGATFASAGGGYEFVNATTVQTDGAVAGDVNDADDTIVVRSPASAGTATVTVYTIGANGAASQEGTITITFTAASGLALDVANSLVVVAKGTASSGGFVDPATELASSSAAGTDPANTANDVWALLLDKNGNPYELGANESIQFSITGVGSLDGGYTTRSRTSGDETDVCVGSAAAPLCDVYAGWQVDLWSNGNAGTANVTAALRNSKTGTATVIGTAKYTFTGIPASFTLSGGASVGAGATATEGIYIAAKDASGNDVDIDGATVTLSSSPAGIGGNKLVDSDADGANFVNPVCPASGSGAHAVTVKWTSGSTTVTSSNTVTITCNAGVAAKVTLTPASAVAAGGTTKVTVTVLDKNGLAVRDGTSVTRLIGAGAATKENGMTTSAGVTSFTWVAPNTNGPVTLWAFSGDASGSVTVNVGSAAAASGITARVGTASYAATTRVARLGQTITWRGALGSAAANASVGVYMRMRAADGSWSTIRRWATRTADASGNVTFSYKYGASKWIQIRFVATGGSTSFLGGVWR